MLGRRFGCFVVSRCSYRSWVYLFLGVRVGFASFVWYVRGGACLIEVVRLPVCVCVVSLSLRDACRA